MNSPNLYNSLDMAKRIKEYAKIKKVSLKQLLIDCNLGSNTFSHMLHGRSIASDSLAYIADYLNCSVDYLLGRTNNPNINELKEKSDINIENIDNEGGTIHIG